MIKNLAAIAFFVSAALTIIGCSKGNPKNTDLVGDKYKQLIVGKWRQVADTTIVTENNVVISTSKTGLTSDYYQYNADGSADQYSGTAKVGTLTYSVANDILTLNSPAVSSGGISIPAFSYPVLIKKLDATDLVLLNHVEAESGAGGTKKTTVTNQITYYKRQ